MAIPRCPKCDSSRFSLEKLNVEKSEYQLLGVCCASCGAIISVQESHNTTFLLFKIAKALNIPLG